MCKSVDSQLSVKACASLDVSKDLEKQQEKTIQELLHEQEEKKEN